MYLSFLQVEVIGGADKYQAACRKCYGALLMDKENGAPFREETPRLAKPEKLWDSGVPRALFSAINLWSHNKTFGGCLGEKSACVWWLEWVMLKGINWFLYQLSYFPIYIWCWVCVTSFGLILDEIALENI